MSRIKKKKIKLEHAFLTYQFGASKKAATITICIMNSQEEIPQKGRISRQGDSPKRHPGHSPKDTQDIPQKTPRTFPQKTSRRFLRKQGEIPHQGRFPQIEEYNVGVSHTCSAEGRYLRSDSMALSFSFSWSQFIISFLISSWDIFIEPRKIAEW